MPARTEFDSVDRSIMHMRRAHGRTLPRGDKRREIMTVVRTNGAFASVTALFSAGGLSPRLSILWSPQ
jgi:hypothetical protein